jgi:hypothetical protein
MLAGDPSVSVGDREMAARLVVTTIESTVHRVIATRDREVDLDSFRRELLSMLTSYLHSP